MSQYEKTSVDIPMHTENEIEVNSEDNDVARCRVCFAEASLINDPLIAPCNCKGGIKWIHRSCLDDWRATKTQDSFTKCEICRFTYELFELQESGKEERIRIFIYYTYVMGYIGVGLVALEAVCALLALILYGLDSKQHSLASYLGATEKDGSDGFLGAYVLWAHLALFFLIGCFGLLYALCLGSSGGSNTTYCFWIDCDNNTDPNGCSLIILLVMVIVVAAIGLFIGIYIASQYFGEKFRRRREILWKKQEVKRLIVKDLSLLAILSTE